MKTRRIPIFLFCLSCLLCTTACGKKGPPFLPKEPFSLTVEGLTGRWENGTLHLKGRVIARGDQPIPGVMACRLYQGWYPLESPPCETCPIAFGELIEAKGEILEDGIFLCEIPLERKKGIHFFEVRLVDPKGNMGPPSNRIKLTIDH